MLPYLQWDCMETKASSYLGFAERISLVSLWHTPLQCCLGRYPVGETRMVNFRKVLAFVFGDSRLGGVN